MKPVFAFLTLLATAMSAQAAQNCMAASEMEASLVDWYGESPVEGSAHGNDVIWASERTGTWSRVRYMGDGNSCVLETGTDWSGAHDAEALIASAD